MRLCVTVFASVRVCVRICVLRQCVANVIVKRSEFPLYVEDGLLYSNLFTIIIQRFHAPLSLLHKDGLILFRNRSTEPVKLKKVNVTESKSLIFVS